MDKIRRLKRKFQANVKRGRKVGVPTFSKAHEKSTFELCRKIWVEEEGTDEEEPKKVIKKPQLAVSHPNIMEAIDLLEKEGGHGIPAGLLKRAAEQLKPARAKAIEEKWGKHFIAAAKYRIERVELMKDLMKALVNTLEDNGS